VEPARLLLRVLAHDAANVSLGPSRLALELEPGRRWWCGWRVVVNFGVVLNTGNVGQRDRLLDGAVSGSTDVHAGVSRARVMLQRLATIWPARVRSPRGLFYYANATRRKA